VIAVAAPIWLACAVVIVVAAVRARRSTEAAAVGRYSVARLDLGAGAAVI
jgi:hypothetical protein